MNDPEEMQRRFLNSVEIIRHASGRDANRAMREWEELQRDLQETIERTHRWMSQYIEDACMDALCLGYSPLHLVVVRSEADSGKTLVARDPWDCERPLASVCMVWDGEYSLVVRAFSWMEMTG